MYMVQNNHPAIIDRKTFNRVQEEMSRRNTVSPQSPQKALTASGKHSKYALTEVLKCGECGSKYRRCTWTSHGKKRIVWRCIVRQMIECIEVFKDGTLLIHFGGGYEIEEYI